VTGTPIAALVATCSLLFVNSRLWPESAVYSTSATAAAEPESRGTTKKDAERMHAPRNPPSDHLDELPTGKERSFYETDVAFRPDCPVRQEAH